MLWNSERGLLGQGEGVKIEVIICLDCADTNRCAHDALRLDVRGGWEWSRHPYKPSRCLAGGKRTEAISKHSPYCPHDRTE